MNDDFKQAIIVYVAFMLIAASFFYILAQLS